MDRTLVIGATGTVGRQVVSRLASAGLRVRAMTRKPEADCFPAEAEVVTGDLTDPDSLEVCLRGVDSVFIVWTAPPTTAEEVFAKISRQARRIVLLSSPHKTAHPFFQQPNRLRDFHAQMDQLVETSGRGWTIVRPGMFAANCAFWWGAQIRSGDAVRWPYAGARTAPIHERDIAEVAVRALLEDKHNGAEYVITGPQSLTQAQLVETIGSVLGRSLRFEEITPDEARSELAYFGPALNMLMNAWSAALDQPAYVTSTVEQVTGTPARTFRQWVQEHASEFRT